MGTHPIFESDFDCLTERNKNMVDNEDDRFDKFKRDPRFKSVKHKKGTRVRVDKRFGAMFEKNSQFNQHLIRDRYGQKKNLSKKERAQILRFYENDDEPGEKEYDRARGIGVSESSESEPDSDSEQSEEEMETDAAANQATYDEPIRSEQIFRRMAMTNMDWDRLNAKDIFVLAASYLPTGGRLERVTVFTSNFGSERIELEKTDGPKMDYKIADPEERKKAHQLDRLKYYYAVCECDSAETADTIYAELDGQEYGETGVRVDLRFIPDEIDFEADTIRKDAFDRLDQADQQPVNYTPPDFVTSALTRSKVDLTWDETPKRRETLLKKMDRKKMVDSSDMVQHLIASGSESDDDDPDHAAKRAETKAKFVQLLGGGGGSSKDNDFFVEKEDDENDDDNSDDNDDGNVEFEMAAPKSDDSDDLISGDEGGEKPKRKKKRKNETVEEEEKEEEKKKRQELELLFTDSSEDEDGGTKKQKHFDLREEERERRVEAKKERKRKWKSKLKTQATPGVDLNDSRFASALLANPDFGIDRTHPQFKYNKAVDEIARRKTTTSANRTTSKGDAKVELSGMGSTSEESKKKAKTVPKDLIARLKLKSRK